MKDFTIKNIMLMFIGLWFVIAGTISFASTQDNSIQRKLAELEATSNIRIGVSAINIGNNSIIQYRGNERFPIQSTFKLIGVAAVLSQSMTNMNLLKQKILYKKQDLVFWSPITEKNIEKGMTISELCAAAMMYSDNTAINLLVKKLGGLNKVTEFARLLKNDSFRLDNWEPNMNSNPSHLQDSSTPIDMQSSLKQLVLGNILDPSVREQLVNWMKGNTTGDSRIRAGVPKGWIVADKTGAGDEYGISNDIGIIWPPNQPPIIIAIYTSHKNKNALRRDDIVAQTTRLIIEEFNNHNSSQLPTNKSTQVLHVRFTKRQK